MGLEADLNLMGLEADVNLMGNVVYPETFKFRKHSITSCKNSPLFFFNLLCKLLAIDATYNSICLNGLKVVVESSFVL